VQGECDNQAHQLWTVTGRGGKKELRLVHTEFCLEVYGAKLATGIPLIQSPCTDEKAQNDIWRVDNRLASLPTTIKSELHSGLCASVSDTALNSPLIQSACSDGEATQNFIFEIVNTYAYRIRVESSRYCLQVLDGATENGAAVVQGPCDDKSHQLWRLAGSGASQELISLHNLYCLKISLGLETEGTKLISWPCLGNLTSTDDWRVDDAIATLPGINTDIESDFSSGMCASATGSTQNAALVQQLCDGGGDQRFTFEQIDEESYTYRVRLGSSRLCVQVSGASRMREADVILGDCADETHQVWTVTGQGAEQKLRVVHTGQCMTVFGGDTVVGTRLIQCPCTGDRTTNDFWRINDRLEAPSLIVTSIESTLHSQLCASAQGNGVDGKLVQRGCDSSTSQRFAFETVRKDVYRVRSISSGLCMQVTNASRLRGARVRQGECQDKVHQLWTVNGASPKMEFRLVHTGMCLNVLGGRKTIGTDLIQWPCTAERSTNDYWKANDQLGGRPSIETAIVSELHSQLCVTVEGSAVNDVSTQSTCDSSTRQIFVFEPVDDDYYRIRVKSSALCLQVEGGSADRGANVVQGP